MGRKTTCTPCSLKHNSFLLFNPVKTDETFNLFFTNIGPNIAKRIPKGKKSPMTYLNVKILKSFFFYPSTPDKTIKITKSFSNNKSAGRNSLPAPILKNCPDVLSFSISYLVNLSFIIGEYSNLCKIAKIISLFEKDDPLDCFSFRPIPLLSTFSKLFENIFTRVFTLFVRKIILFLSNSLALATIWRQLIHLIIK